MGESIRAAIYARTAMPDQAVIRQKTETLTGQIQNMWGNNTEVDIYADNSFSGLQTTRPGLQKLLQKVGAYNGVFVWNMARLSQVVPETISLHRQLQDMGTKLYAADISVMEIEIMEGTKEILAGFST